MKAFTLNFLLASNLCLVGMEQPPQTIITALFRLRHESEWPYFEEFQQQLYENKEKIIAQKFGTKIDYYCKTMASDANVQLINRWVELYTLDQTLKLETPDRSLPQTLKELWYLEHGSQPFPYEGIVTKLCRSGLKSDFEKLVNEAKQNIDKAIKDINE